MFEMVAVEKTSRSPLLVASYLLEPTPMPFPVLPAEVVSAPSGELTVKLRS
jgi:hypothetical protein